MLTMKGVRKSFVSGEVKEEVLKGVGLSLKPGEVTALVGASGSGKSTLLTIAAGLQSATGGEIVFNGSCLSDAGERELRAVRATQFGFIFQAAHLVPFLNVEEQLELMLDVAGSSLSKKEKRLKTMHVLEQVGMSHRKSAYPSSLSGGERQRVAIARAIIHGPKMIFADEPTASLDSSRSHDVMSLIRTLTRSGGLTTLVVTHDEEMLRYADRVVTMRDGVIVGE